MNKIWGTTLFLGETSLETIYGNYIVKVYQNIITKRYILTLIYEKTNLESEKLELYTRIHSSCVTSEMLNSQDCDCVEQLNGALKTIAEKGQGILFYLIQEGRGCGYIGKARACQMVQYSEYIHDQCLHHEHTHKSHNHNDEPLTTFDAYNNLGMKPDYRRYGNIKEILEMLNIYNKASFILLSNNPDKINAFKKHNIKLIRTESIEFIPNAYNKSYLISKNKYGHILNKTNEKIPLYSLPVNAIKPFEPYHLEHLKRFVYCASYYIPIKPFDNHIILPDSQLQKININVKKENNLYQLDSNIIENMEIKPAYWFKVNLFYDISSNLDYIVLEYKNPYNFVDKDPIIRFHSEALFDRFPLKEKLYQNRYKRAILEIVKNGFGYLVLFYRDGRGSGLGYYLLNLQKLNSNKIGITKDKRDYDAAIMLIKFFIRNRKINLLYSNNSINSLKNKLGKHNVNVSKYINIDDVDNKGSKSIITRIINLDNILNIPSTHYNLTFKNTDKYIITGIGSSKSHSMYLCYILKKYYSIQLEFVPILAFNTIENKGEKLIVISQGLSNNTHIAIKKWQYKNIILLTGSKVSKTLEDNKKKIIDNLLLNHSKILYFPDDQEDNTLVRITGPVSGFKFIYDNFIPKNKIVSYKFNNQQNNLLNYDILNLFITKRKELNIYIIGEYPLINFAEDLGNRIMETVFCPKPRIVDYFEFVHGPYQTCLDNDYTIYICLESKLFNIFKSMFNNTNRIIYLESNMDLDLKIIDYGLIINSWIKQIVETSDIDFVNWNGKYLQHKMYSLS